MITDHSPDFFFYFILVTRTRLLWLAIMYIICCITTATIPMEIKIIETD